METNIERGDRYVTALVCSAGLLGIAAACCPWQTVVDTVTGGAVGSGPFTTRWGAYLWDGSVIPQDAVGVNMWAGFGLLGMIGVSFFSLERLLRRHQAAAGENRELAVLTTLAAAGALVTTGLWLVGLLLSPSYNTGVLVVAHIELSPSAGVLLAVLAGFCLLTAGLTLWRSTINGCAGKHIGPQTPAG